MKQRCLQIATAFAFIKRRGKALLISSCGNYRSIASIARIPASRCSRHFSHISACVIFSLVPPRGRGGRELRDFLTLHAHFARRYQKPNPPPPPQITGPLSETDRHQVGQIGPRLSANIRKVSRCFRSACHGDAGGAFLNRRPPERTRAGINIAKSAGSAYPFVYACRAEFHFDDSISSRDK